MTSGRRQDLIGPATDCKDIKAWTIHRAGDINNKFWLQTSSPRWCRGLRTPSAAGQTSRHLKDAMFKTGEGSNCALTVCVLSHCQWIFSLVLSPKFSSIQKYHLADVALVIQLALLVVTILKHTTIYPGRATNIIELCWNEMFNHYNVQCLFFLMCHV